MDPNSMKTPDKYARMSMAYNVMSPPVDARRATTISGAQVRSNSSQRADMSTPSPGEHKYKYKQLPTNFADDVLELEHEIESGSITTEKVNKLIGLYAAAVEYYESIKNKKYQIFMDKMKNLMVRPEVIEAMNKPTLSEAETKANLQKRAKQKEMEMNLYLAKQNASDKEALDIIAKHQKLSEDKDQLIQKELLTQQEQIKRRLEERKKAAAQARSTSVPAKKEEEENSSPLTRLQNAETSRRNSKNNGIQFTKRPSRIMQENEEESKDGSKGLDSSDERGRRHSGRRAEAVGSEGERAPTISLQPIKEEEKTNEFKAETSPEAELAQFEYECAKESEALIERLNKEKDDKEGAVRAKFEKQISDIESQIDPSKPNMLLSKLLQKLKRDQQTELDKLTAEYTEKIRAEGLQLEADIQSRRDAKMKSLGLQCITYIFSDIYIQIWFNFRRLIVELFHSIKSVSHSCTCRYTHTHTCLLYTSPSPRDQA
eukprot:TRINITY_DN7519_c0_g2_i1.p1 TRINITY_DN7519_c0_g2~~TRINITY_DN7519_c0_g2_i1.p1  ORF type:complete len:487 (-),score=131.62 TRINITY_DN7519_c0_g2_i1:23-1483(-)